jgi:polyisoprenoid-binding protein YceI
VSARYVFDKAAGTFTAQAFKTGLLSPFGHSPTFAVRDHSGEARFGAGGLADLHLELTIVADSLSLLDRVSDADRREIENRMRVEVLETQSFPEIRYQADRLSDERIAAGRYRLRIGGPLSLHGASRPHQIDVELTVYDDALQIRGETSVRLSDYQIRPVSALAGAIKLKDEVRLAFDLSIPKEET